MSLCQRQTREFIDRLERATPALPAGIGLDCLLGRTVVAVADCFEEHRFVFETPRHSEHVLGDAEEIVRAVTHLLLTLIDQIPGGGVFPVWVLPLSRHARQWSVIRICERDLGPARDGASVGRTLYALGGMVARLSGKLEVNWNAHGAVDVALWLPSLSLETLVTPQQNGGRA